MLLAERTQAHVLKCTFSAALSSFQTSLCAPRDPSVWGGVSSPLLPYLTRPLPLPPSVLCPHCLSERPATHYSQTTPKSLELFVPHPFSQGHWPLPFCLSLSGPSTKSPVWIIWTINGSNSSSHTEFQPLCKFFSTSSRET